MAIGRRKLLTIGGAAVVAAGAGIGAGWHFILRKTHRLRRADIQEEFLEGKTVAYRDLIVSKSEYDWLVTRVGLDADNAQVVELLATEFHSR